MNINYIYFGLIVLFFMMLMMFIVHRIIKSNKKKRQRLDEENLGKMDENINKTSNIQKNTIKIKIYRDVGGGTVALAGKFYATEETDKNNNLFAINDERKFKEEVEFTKDRVYEMINIDLSLRGKPKQEQARLVIQKINEQEKLIEEINRNDQLNAKYNFPDEELKLKQLKIYLETLKRSDIGSYVTWEENGIRTYYFKAIDGILHPYWWDNCKLRVDADLTVKKKIYVHEKLVYNAENAAFDKKVNWTGLILCIIGALMLCVGGVLQYKYWKNTSEMEIQINKGALECQQTLASCTTAYNNLKLGEMACLLADKSESNINAQKQNTNIDLTPTTTIAK